MRQEDRPFVCRYLCVLDIVPRQTQAQIGVCFELSRLIGLHGRDISPDARFFRWAPVRLVPAGPHHRVVVIDMRQQPQNAQYVGILY
jgi:hypothetical protein